MNKRELAVETEKLMAKIISKYASISDEALLRAELELLVQMARVQLLKELSGGM